MPPTPKSDAGLSSPGMHRRDGQTGAQRRGGPEARSQRRIADRATASRCVPLGGEIRLGSRCLAPSELRVGVRARRARTRTGGAAICTCLVPLGQHVLQRPTRCTGIGGQKVSRMFRIHDRITISVDSFPIYGYAASRSYLVESILKIVHLIASLRVYALPFYEVGALTAHRPAPPHATCPSRGRSKPRKTQPRPAATTTPEQHCRPLRGAARPAPHKGAGSHRPEPRAADPTRADRRFPAGERRGRRHLRRWTHQRTDRPTSRQARPGPAVDGQRSTPGGFTDTTVRPVAGT